MPRRPDIEEEDVGSRSFEVQRSRAVEAAVGRIRHGLGHRWDLFVPDEVQALEWILGEAWVVTGSREWEHFGFSHSTPELVEELVALSQKARTGREIPLLAARKAKHLLGQLPPPGEAADEREPAVPEP